MASTWEVTGDQGGQFQWSAIGNPVQGHIISFITGLSNTGTVFVPDTQYTAPKVRVLVAAQAALADEIATLKS